YREVTVSANGQMGLVVSPDIDLRLFLGGWNAVFAIAEETARGTQRSIQVFDQQGVAVHKVFLAEASDVRAWEPLVCRLDAALGTTRCLLGNGEDGVPPRNRRRSISGETTRPICPLAET
ncbi:ChuX/HutX family heme-like substrate-binding protein, partial [Pseudomonas aeruginosa]